MATKSDERELREEMERLQQEFARLKDAVDCWKDTAQTPPHQTSSDDGDSEIKDALVALRQEIREMRKARLRDEISRLERTLDGCCDCAPRHHTCCVSVPGAASCASGPPSPPYPPYPPFPPYPPYPPAAPAPPYPPFPPYPPHAAQVCAVSAPPCLPVKSTCPPAPAPAPQPAPQPSSSRAPPPPPASSTSSSSLRREWPSSSRVASSSSRVASSSYFHGPN